MSNQLLKEFMPKNKPTIITATEMQKKSGEIIRRAHKGGEHFIVERDGYPVVAIVRVDEYRKWLLNKNGEINAP
jgi:prevent-host-death family protein